jgi:hypothetical protein
MSAQPVERTITVETGMLRDLLEAFRAATAAALATRQPLAEDVIEELARRHDVDPAVLRDTTAAFLLQTTVQRQLDEGEMAAVVRTFTLAAQMVAPHLPDEIRTRPR